MMKSIIKFCKKNQRIVLLFSFILWVNSHPVPDEVIPASQTTSIVVTGTTVPVQSALGVCGGQSSNRESSATGFAGSSGNRGQCPAGPPSSGNSNRGVDIFEDYNPKISIPGVGGSGSNSDTVASTSTLADNNYRSKKTGISMNGLMKKMRIILITKTNLVWARFKLPSIFHIHWTTTVILLYLFRILIPLGLLEVKLLTELTLIKRQRICIIARF